MQLETAIFPEGARDIVDTRFDCIWIHLADWKREQGLSTPFLKWIDWRMRGELSRALLAGGSNGQVLFLPTRGRIASPLVAIWQERDPLSESFSRNAKGQGWQQVLYYNPNSTLDGRLSEALHSLPAEPPKEMPKVFVYKG